MLKNYEYCLKIIYLNDIENQNNHQNNQTLAKKDTITTTVTTTITFNVATPAETLLGTMRYCVGSISRHSPSYDVYIYILLSN